MPVSDVITEQHCSASKNKARTNKERQARWLSLQVGATIHPPLWVGGALRNSLHAFTLACVRSEDITQKSTGGSGGGNRSK